jgi:hypothetical protein
MQSTDAEDKPPMPDGPDSCGQWRSIDLSATYRQASALQVVHTDVLAITTQNCYSTKFKMLAS